RPSAARHQHCAAPPRSNAVRCWRVAAQGPLLPPRTFACIIAAMTLPPDGWMLDEARPALTRTFRCKDFSEAFGFMTRLALADEKADHHPEWTNVWNRVDIVLTTHDAGGVTDKDHALAEVANRLAAGT